MNTSLYNLLVNARVCAQKKEETDRKIEKLRHEENLYMNTLAFYNNEEEYRKRHYPTRGEKAESFFEKYMFPNFGDSDGCLFAIFHLIYITPLMLICAALFYAFRRVFGFIGKSKRARNQEEIKKRCQNEIRATLPHIHQKLYAIKTQINELEREKLTFYNRYGNPLKSIYEGYHRVEAIDRLMAYVKSERAYTLQQAYNLLQDYYEKMEERERLAEEQRERQKALDDIKYNQERIINELEDIRRNLYR